MQPNRCDNPVARRLFRRAKGNNGVPGRIFIDKSGVNLSGLEAVNVILKFIGTGEIIKILQAKYLNAFKQFARFAA
ncbi:hypothetical protein [Yoonia sp.]|uniref:hypothetical protein n=1 Tax=Yoonia sp. TaxID=2212373 RepID=UPI0019E06042|nr:hypothetical protein [Yoonia sp.]MBE0413748.1 hypothetical protein [Yoonia sp.]